MNVELEIREIEKNGIKDFRLIAGDTTPEALTSLICDNKGVMSIISDEGGFFNILAGQYNKNGVVIDTILQAHNGNPIRVDRKGRASESIDKPCLTMVVSVQDSVVYNLFNNGQFSGRGLLARILYCKPLSKMGSRSFDTKPITPEVKKAYEEAVLRLLRYFDIGDLLQLSDEAKKISEEWFYFLEPMHVNELVDMCYWSGKLHGATLRIAGLLHCMKHFNNLEKNTFVDEAIMRNAVEIAKYLLEHAKWAYSTMGANTRMEDAQYVLKKIIKDKTHPLSRRDILRLCRRFQQTRELIPALELLEEYGYISSHAQEATHPGCKPNVIYEVNPYVTNVTDVTDM